MKMLASLVLLAALGAVIAPSPALAGGSLHEGRRVVILEQRPVIITRPNVFIAQPRPLFLDRPIIVQRPFLFAQPVIVQRPFLSGQPIIVQPVVAPRSSFIFTVPGTVTVIR